MVVEMRLGDSNDRMRIAICDESREDRLALKTFVTRYFRGAAVPCESILYDNIQMLACDILGGATFDLLIMDVYYSGLPIGMGMAKELRKQGCRSAILFSCVSGAFLLESYDVAAVGYLMKPIRYEKLTDVLGRLAEHLLHTCYLVQQKSRLIYIPINEIMYFESANTKCYIHRAFGETLTIYRQLREVERELDDERFLRCHQSFLVNMHYVAEARDVFVLRDGTEVLIRQKSRKQFHEVLKNYLGNENITTKGMNYQY